ncbi:MAG TPA: S49 family peptidase [Phycisphaerae bacterium]|nr:S49 family peptidase [Phycisphaerae bacterium]
MLKDDSPILAVEPECYRNWLGQTQPAITASILEELRGPQAAARLRPAKRNVGDIAVLRLSGFIAQKPSLMTLLFGGTSTEALVADLRAALAEPSVGAVVLDVNSPGGSVFGVPEAAAQIREMRGAKPMIAVSNPFMASAAYYLAAQMDEIVAIPSSITGSVGVMSVHVDDTEARKRAGISVEAFTYGRRKAEESGIDSLSDEARGAIQARVDYYGAMFEEDVARGRGVKRSDVSARFGQGAVFNAREALAVGMVDRIGTMEDVLRGMGGAGRRGVSAVADPVEIAARAALAGLTMTGTGAVE